MGGRQCRGARAGVLAVRGALRIPSRFLRGERPAEQGNRRKSRRVCQARPDGAQAPFGDLAAANAAAAAWCAEVNGVIHSEICAVPAERLVTERELLASLPSLRASTGRQVLRKVDRLSCVFSELRDNVAVQEAVQPRRRTTTMSGKSSLTGP